MRRSFEGLKNTVAAKFYLMRHDVSFNEPPFSKARTLRAKKKLLANALRVKYGKRYRNPAKFAQPVCDSSDISDQLKTLMHQLRDLRGVIDE